MTPTFPPADPAEPALTVDPADPALTVDGTGLLCVTLLLRLRGETEGAPPGTVVHVIATDPAAPLDLPARCHMTGHTYLGPVPGERPVYALRLTAGARATRPDAPWHALGRTAWGGPPTCDVRGCGSPGKSPVRGS